MTHNYNYVYVVSNTIRLHKDMRLIIVYINCDYGHLESRINTFQIDPHAYNSCPKLG